jgi:hypothetical protein
VTVRWDLTGLIPLKEAREKHPVAAAAAVKDFEGALERVAKVFATPSSGYVKYREAFTVPSLEADGGAHYFYSPVSKKLLVINWGASPRSMGGKAEYVFGYEDWAKQWGEAGIAATATAAGAVAAAAAVAAPPTNAGAAKNDKNDARKGANARAWWVRPLFGLMAIALVLLTLFFLRACEDQSSGPGQATDAQAEAASVDSGGNPDGAALDAADGAALDDASEASDAATAGDAAADAATAGDAAADAATAGDAAADAATAGDAGRDGALTMDDDDDDDFPEGSSGGTVIVKIGPGGGQKTGVHRKHYSDEAVQWRIGAGAQKVSRTEQSGRRFDVWLSPGQTFEGVRVEWQDKAGKWHVH